jgi:hypothetical protein
MVVFSFLNDITKTQASRRRTKNYQILEDIFISVPSMNKEIVVRKKTENTKKDSLKAKMSRLKLDYEL